MSKHATFPKYNNNRERSHVSGWSNNPIGNWNRHKKRRINSSARTAGRYKRFCKRAGQFYGETLTKMLVDHEK